MFMNIAKILTIMLFYPQKNSTTGRGVYNKIDICIIFSTDLLFP